MFESKIKNQNQISINCSSRYDIQVNCWFCNNNSRVPYAQRSSWTCAHCEQYNGFNEDGDYNRDILQQRANLSQQSPSASASASLSRDSSASSGGGGSGNYCANSYYNNELGAATPTNGNGNGFCDHCNEAQRLKVEKLAQFEPKNESRFEQELKLYRTQLEQQFRLCESCERHVRQVLTEKKKLVLGSKFLNFVMRSAALLKQPHYNHLARVQQQRRLQRCQQLMLLLTLLQALCLLASLTPARRAHFTALLGERLGALLHLVYSHALTLWRVLADYAGQLLGQLSDQRPTLDKLALYGRTLGKLLLYSAGLTQQQAQQATLGSCYGALYPYAMLALSFLHNVCDGLRFTRYTLLLLLWSVQAEGTLPASLPGATPELVGNLLAALTLLLLLTQRGDALLLLAHNESVGDSFHRLCADECISDDETISLLSQQLSCSAASQSSPRQSNNYGNSNGNSNGNNSNGSSLPRRVAPSVLSLDSLRLSSARSPAPSCRTLAHNYAASSYEQQQQQQNLPHNLPQQAWGNYGWQRGVQQPQQQLQQQRVQPLPPPPRQSLLLPSRLDVGAWVHATSTCGSPQLPELLEQRCCSSTDKQQQLSRTSSQSSGFESQAGNGNGNGNVQHWGNLPTQQQQQQPHAAPTLPAASEYGWGESVQRQPLRIAAPLPSPYSTQSELSYAPLLQTQAQAQPQELRPGDLLRRWMDRNAERMRVCTD
ncbi:hypothetical protein KR222_004720 [Zaprionus bogoriensis]|nr:hypothetical protein KR222_004720 [Zaprionus bogoriensis]